MLRVSVKLSCPEPSQYKLSPFVCEPTHFSTATSILGSIGKCFIYLICWFYVLIGVKLVRRGLWLTVLNNQYDFEKSPCEELVVNWASLYSPALHTQATKLVEFEGPWLRNGLKSPALILPWHARQLSPNGRNRFCLRHGPLSERGTPCLSEPCWILSPVTPCHGVWMPLPKERSEK